MARVSNNHFSVIRVMHCLIRSCLMAPYTKARRRQKRKGLLAHTRRMNVALSTQTINSAFSHPAYNSYALPRIGITPSEAPHQKASRMYGHSMREASSLQTRVLEWCRLLID